MKTQTKLDSFTRAYIQAALWSSTEHPFAECPVCGKMALLSHYPEKEYEQELMCSAEGCGVRENENPPPMDEHYSLSDLIDSAMERIQHDCAKFQAENGTPDYGERGHGNGGDAACAGHDFWLTRNGHGVGFWDRDELSEADQKRLTDAAHAFGECYIYVGDDGQLHIS